MKVSRALLLTLTVVVVLLPFAFSRIAEGGPGDAPAGYDDLTNGFVNQTTHDTDRAVFEQARTLTDGLGPAYNRASCADCHTTPVSGGVSAVTNLLAGSDLSGSFVARLIHDNAICPAAQDPPPAPTEITTRRLTVNLLGDGYVEAIGDSTFTQIQASQPAGMRGTILRVPVPGAPGATEIGRFGWKNQQSDLLTFSAIEFFNQIGITSSLLPVETPTCDTVADPEDITNDTAAFARFIRATKVPPRDTVLAATSDAQAGASVFNGVGCNLCHISSMTTVPPGTVMHQGTYVVVAALGSKTIHPYSDFMLHDVGTGDGFGPSPVRLKMRTAPLWGLRTHPVFLHDGSALTLLDAIQRHAGEATTVTTNFNSLSATQKRQLITFLRSL